MVRTPLERGDGPVQMIVPEVAFDLVEFVQLQLEPQLVGLVDDDEQHFIVFGRIRARRLQLQELIELQIAGIGEVHDGCHPRSV